MKDKKESGKHIIYLSTALVALSLISRIPSDASTKISPLYNGSGTLDPFDVDYWWIQDVDKGDLVLLNIQIPTIFDWQSRLYYSNLTLIYENTTDGTHIYEFHAKETDNYLLRLYANHELGYITECSHLVMKVVGITELSINQTVIGQGLTLKGYVTVSNIGSSDETIDALTVFYESNLIENFTLVNLAPGQTKTIEFNWITEGVPKGSYTITARCVVLAHEIDYIYINGDAIFAMVGDIIGPEDPPDSGLYPPDGEVDMRDVAAVARLFGVNHPDPRYDPNCDIVYDGKVDMKDVATVCKHFGEIDP